MSRITPDIEKNHLDAPMKSKRIARRRLAAPSAAGLRRTDERPRVARIACVASTAVRNDTIVPMPSTKAKPFTPAVARMNRMNAVISVTTLASMIAVRPFLYPTAIPRGDRGPAAYLLLHPFEYHDVGVGRHPDGEDQAGDPRQRQRDRYELDQGREVEGVERQGADGDQAEHAVEHEQEERHERQAHEAGGDALVERLLAQRGRDLRLRDQLELDRQRADLEQLGQVLGGLDREAALDVGAVRAVDPVGVLLEVDVGDGHQLAVEDGGEVLEGLLR